MKKQTKRKVWNKGLTKETDERVKINAEGTSRTRKELSQEGKLKIWSTGLTKETDERVNNISKRMKGSNNPMKRREVREKMKQTQISMPGHPHTYKSKKDISKSVKKSWEEETTRNKHLKSIQKLSVRKILSVKGQGIDIKDWKGFISFEPYTKEFNDKFKRLIRKRDNYICLKCGRHQEKEKRSLSVHHIDYNKELTIKENCCTVCRKCNNEANTNRKHWAKFFQSLLSEKYGYKYSEDNKIILDISLKESS